MPSARTLSVWLSTVCKGTVDRTSHIFRVLSWDAVTRWCSDVGLQARARIQSVWDVQVRIACGVRNDNKGACTRAYPRPAVYTYK